MRSRDDISPVASWHHLRDSTIRMASKMSRRQGRREGWLFNTPFWLGMCVLAFAGGMGFEVLRSKVHAGVDRDSMVASLDRRLGEYQELAKSQAAMIAGFDQELRECKGTKK